MTSHWDSNLHFLMADDVGHNPMCSISHLHILFGEMSSCLQSVFKLGWLVCFWSGVFVVVFLVLSGFAGYLHSLATRSLSDR